MSFMCLDLRTNTRNSFLVQDCFILKFSVKKLIGVESVYIVKKFRIYNDYYLYYIYLHIFNRSMIKIKLINFYYIIWYAWT